MRPRTRFMSIQTREVAAGLQNGGMPSRATIGVMAVAVAAGLWGMDALIRRPLAHSTEPATIVLGEHVVLVLVLLPVVVAALPAVWRAGPRFVAAAIVVGAGSSALATILFTQAFVDGNPVTPVVLQKVQPLIAVSLAAVMLGERPRPRFGLFLIGGLAGTWLMAFPSPFDVSLHGQAPVLYALMAAALWALGTVLGRFLALELPYQQVTALRFAFGLPAALAAVLVLGAPLRASLHDELFIALLALVTGLVALLLYYYGLQRTTASVASVAELAFPVVAIAVGYFAFDATLTQHAARRRRAHEPRRPAAATAWPGARRRTGAAARPGREPRVVSARPGRGSRSRSRAARPSGTGRARSAAGDRGCP